MASQPKLLSAKFNLPNFIYTVTQEPHEFPDGPSSSCYFRNTVFALEHISEWRP